MPDNPYAADLAGREPLAAMRQALEAVESMTSDFDDDAWQRSYAPGKWTARQVLVHLAAIEQFFGTRLRLALTVGDYVVQPMEQDDVMALEAGVSGPSARASFTGQRRANLELLASLTPAQWSVGFHHPERGAITVRYLVEYWAGHDWRHVGQLKTMAAARR
jgi:uncharacterized damage-inducible protein DinB